MIEKVKYGEVWLADINGGIGSEMSGIRPVLCCSTNLGNSRSSIAQVIPITSQVKKKRLPTHVFLDSNKFGLAENSVALCEQSKCIEQGRLICKITELDSEIMKDIEHAIKINFGMVSPFENKREYQLQNDLHNKNIIIGGKTLCRL
ncbi:hypothetical protein BC351_00605 [Paenibacillus ferrarius]|uniref:mRNA interferase n=1 Tax=Paenibacillus ferrarius TaxID=1469647 RepID=A0A1V4HT80_9BACL|nr:type II toxin-antitoxin system PemK/MazF family toxin [Paenibacillus ferrarius]OPH61775.1 hypothetical protein BC351_00605 [Paenibacillus ferrarius]